MPSYGRFFFFIYIYFFFLLKYSNGVRNKEKTQKIIYMKEKNGTVKDQNKAAKEKENRVLAYCCNVTPLECPR